MGERERRAESRAENGERRADNCQTFTKNNIIFEYSLNIRIFSDIFEYSIGKFPSKTVFLPQ